MRPGTDTASHRPDGPWRWLGRVLAVVLLTITGLSIAGVTGTPAFADSDNCNPTGVPDQPGTGLPGSINSAPPNPTPEGGRKTLHEQYGWSGLDWHTCDLGDGSWGSNFIPEAAKDLGAWLDTGLGNILMGTASTLGAAITQLDRWATTDSPLGPIDNTLTTIATSVRDSVWGPWSLVVVLGAACCVIAWAWRGQIRRVASTCIAIGLGALAVAALGAPFGDTGKPGAVGLGTQFDTAAASIIGGTNTALATGLGQPATGTPPNTALGATLYDNILVPLWIKGAVGPGAGQVGQLIEGKRTLATDIFMANTASYAEKKAEEEAKKNNQPPPGSKLDSYKYVAKVLDGKQSLTDEEKAQINWDKNQAQYDQLRGSSGGRAALGFEALAAMVAIAVIKIPCSLFLLLGLIVIRLVVMFIPVWALFGMIEATRPTATGAFKMVVAAVYNAAVFGVFGAIHTAIVTAIITDGEYNFGKLFLIAMFTAVVWKVSKPFRNVTTPAVGDILAGVGDNPLGRGRDFLPHPHRPRGSRYPRQRSRPDDQPRDRRDESPSDTGDTGPEPSPDRSTPPVRRPPLPQWNKKQLPFGRGPSTSPGHGPGAGGFPAPSSPDGGSGRSAGGWVPHPLRPAPPDEGVPLPDGTRMSLRPKMTMPPPTGPSSPWVPPEQRTEKWWRDRKQWREPERTKYGYSTWDPWTPEELDGKKPSRAD